MTTMNVPDGIQTTNAACCAAVLRGDGAGMAAAYCSKGVAALSWRSILASQAPSRASTRPNDG